MINKLIYYFRFGHVDSASKRKGWASQEKSERKEVRGVEVDEGKAEEEEVDEGKAEDEVEDFVSTFYYPQDRIIL